MNDETDPIILPDSVQSEQLRDQPDPDPGFGPDAKATDAKPRIKSGYPERKLGQSPVDLYVDRIIWMNTKFKLDYNEQPTNLGVLRLLQHYKTIIDEVTELLECVNDEKFIYYIIENDVFLNQSDDPNYLQTIIDTYEQQNNIKLEINMTAVADTLVDINVYNVSEVMRWGIPISCFHAVMDSQASKLDSDGQPVMSEDGSKFIKGPYFQPPEPTIREILESYECQED